MISEHVCVVFFPPSLALFLCHALPFLLLCSKLTPLLYFFLRRQLNVLVIRMKKKERKKERRERERKKDRRSRLALF